MKNKQSIDMASEIKHANDYILKHKNEVSLQKSRPKLHFAPPVGWMNDPNGFIYFNDQYHLFYQYHPYAPQWHSMYWGHAVSDDLIFWEDLPVALAPSESYDYDEFGGCFSGTTIIKDEILYLFYSGVISDENGDFLQTQCVAMSEDGINFKKYEHNPVIVHPPKNVKPSEFRDPKVWEKDGSYYMLVGVSIAGVGNANLYRSDDLLEWENVGPIISTVNNQLGTMWECPDFFELDGHEVLIISPLGLSDIITMYLLGTLDYQTGNFQVEKTGIVDYGTDFYAPQSIVDSHNRRILVGWQNGWDWMPKWNGFGPTASEGWSGSMSIPREAFFSDNELRFKPAIELTCAVKKRKSLEKIQISPQVKKIFSNVKQPFQLQFELEISDEFHLYFAHTTGSIDELTISSNNIVYNAVNNKFGKNNIIMPVETSSIKLNVISDTTSIEIFEEVSGRVMSINHFNYDDLNISVSSNSNLVVKSITLGSYNE